MCNKAKLILSIGFIVLLAAAPVTAQTQTPPPSTPQRAVVSGKIVNRSNGGSIPARLDLVLHAWDRNSNEKLMQDGQSTPDGTFRFESIPIERDLSYGVMAIYNDVTYFSKPIVAQGQPLTNIEIPIYETIDDSSSVQIERTVVLFFYTPSGLEVAEVYNASTTGDRTVKDVVKLADGQLATLQFSLLAEAINVAFDPTTKNQLVRTPGGFAYTGPLLPGAPASRVAVRYVLPYTSGMTYTLEAEYPMRDVSFLIEREAGFALTGEGLTDGGLQKIGADRQFAVMERGALQAGEKAVVTLTGQPKVSTIGQPTADLPAADATRVSEAVLGFAGVLLALGLGIFGVWWFRRPESALVLTEVSDESALTDSPAQITVSNKAHGQGGQEPDNVHRDDSFQQAQDTTQDSKHFTDCA